MVVERERSNPEATDCLVFFPSASCDLRRAADALKAYRLTVAEHGGELSVGRPDAPQFRVYLEAGATVRTEAIEIAEGTPHSAGMRECDARFVIVIDDLDAALDEINTLMEVQGALQDESQGYLFLPWNGNLSEPWRE
jgi:hypothetical protein